MRRATVPPSLPLSPPAISAAFTSLGGWDAVDSIGLIHFYHDVTGRPQKKRIISLECGCHGSGPTGVDVARASQIGGVRLAYLSMPPFLVGWLRQPLGCRNRTVSAVRCTGWLWHEAFVVTPGVRLDRIDMKILIELQNNGRMTNVTLADAVGLSPSPCLLRVKRLEQAGFISGYGATINLQKLGETITVFTEITLADHTKEYFIRFETALRRVDEVVECHMVSGGYDYLVKFVTRGLTHYQSLIETLLDRNIGISKYFSYVVIKSPIQKPGYPLPVLFGL